MAITLSHITIHIHAQKAFKSSWTMEVKGNINFPCNLGSLFVFLCIYVYVHIYEKYVKVYLSICNPVMPATIFFIFKFYLKGKEGEYTSVHTQILSTFRSESSSDRETQSRSPMRMPGTQTPETFPAASQGTCWAGGSWS